jgi:hypothetical protein
LSILLLPVVVAVAGLLLVAALVGLEPERVLL